MTSRKYTNCSPCSDEVAESQSLYLTADLPPVRVPCAGVMSETPTRRDEAWDVLSQAGWALQLRRHRGRLFSGLERAGRQGGEDRGFLGVQRASRRALRPCPGSQSLWGPLPGQELCVGRP